MKSGVIKELTFKNSQGKELTADLFLPKGKPPYPVVAFAHGLYSSRKSPRNRQIAEALQEKGIAALLFDFSEREFFSYETFVQHADDLKCSLDLLETLPEIDKNKMAVNGSSTGTIAGLYLTAEDLRIKTMVLRSSRVFGVFERVSKIKIPILLISGELDEVKFESEKLYQALKTEKKFEVIPGAGHLFEEGDTFSKLLKLTVDWYVEKLK